MQHKHEFTDGICDHCGLIEPDHEFGTDWSDKVAINDPEYIRMERELDQKDANS